LKYTVASGLLLFLFFPTLTAEAHQPVFSGGNTSPTHAQWISNPSDSWVIYGQLNDPAETRYYAFYGAIGQTIDAALSVPAVPNCAGFNPVVAIVGPSLPAATQEVASHVEVPAGSGSLSFNSSGLGEKSYEGFSQTVSWNKQNMSVILPATGTYYLAVFAEGDLGCGKYTLAVGDIETFTALGWIYLPISILQVKSFFEQNPALTLGPVLLSVAIGTFLVHRRLEKNHVKVSPKLQALSWAAIISGLIMIGGAASGFLVIGLNYSLLTAFDAIPATMIVAGLIIGIFVVRAGAKIAKGRPSLAGGVALLTLGALGLLVWSGYMVGAIVVVSVGVATIFLKKSAYAKSPLQQTVQIPQTSSKRSTPK